jgi:gluconokinase
VIIEEETLSTVAPDHADSPLILALDVGTSSVRALLFDRLGRAVEGMESRQHYTIHATTDGASEIDPDALLEHLWRCLDTLLESVGSFGSDIAGVATCTFVSNVLGVDEAGRAVTPLTTYADTRAAQEVARLREEFDEETVHQRTGCPFHTSYHPARLRWLARSQPELFESVDRWISIGEYIDLQLFGKAVVSYSVASWTGLLDRRRLVWDEPLLAALPLSGEQLSPLSDVDLPRRGLREPFASRWPALCDLPWFPAAGDGATANVGSGCTSPERVALTMGTTSAVRVIVGGDVPRVPAGLWCYRVDGRRSLPGAALSEGGNVFAWLRDTLRLPPPEDLEPSLASLAPDAHGLTMLPFLTGERSPGWAGHARAAISGLSLATTPLEILQAGLEAVAYRIGLVFDLLQPLLPDDFEVVASGGALLHSPVWCQIVADVLDRPVAVSRVEEASARGAALLALEALGLLHDIGQAPPFVGSFVEPDAGRHARYAEAMERQQLLYQKLVAAAP